ncbi:DinB family protein [Fodinicola feengrottensis]|uniref:hypothetical protein n=1 Tax=Fodinicola feengrottensis TaxID=435914 RepID=UPI0013D65A5E|nr:hypothetical protein [Fodinicola feengrottensis]
MIEISSVGLTACVVAVAGSVEIAVHGWDIAQATGRPRPIPRALATELLEVAPLLVADGDRPGLFGPRVWVTGPAAASDRLVAYLGRQP